MTYIESYVVPVVTARIDEYLAIARESALIWRELGALSVIEAQAVDAPLGEVTSFPRSVALTPEETVFVAYLTFRDRAHRDAVMARMESHSRMIDLFTLAPVDGRRMIWGGFEVVAQA